MASDAKNNPVDGDEALELLDQRAETTLARLQTAWLPGFLEDQGERFVHLVVHEVSARRLESTPISVPTTRPVSRQLESSSLSKGVFWNTPLVSRSRPTDVQPGVSRLNCALFRYPGGTRRLPR